MAENTLQSVLNIAQTLLTQVPVQDITPVLITEKVDIAAGMIPGGMDIRKEAIVELVSRIKTENFAIKTTPKLVTGGDNSFLPHLCQSIRRASEIDFAVAFITATGLRLLLPDLHDALEPNFYAGQSHGRKSLTTGRKM